MQLVLIKGIRIQFTSSLLVSLIIYYLIMPFIVKIKSVSRKYTKEGPRSFAKLLEAKFQLTVSATMLQQQAVMFTLCPKHAFCLVWKAHMCACIVLVTSMQVCRLSII